MLRLSSADKAMLSGARGEGAQLAMRMIVHIAEGFGAERLIDIGWAHVASAYYQGQANLISRVACAMQTRKLPFPRL